MEFAGVVSVLLFVYLLYVFYLAYVTLRVARNNGKLAVTPWPVRYVAYSILVIALILDVLFNVMIGSLLFFEFPHFKRLTFTKRCSYHIYFQTWRGSLARWFCEGWLNPFEDKHCH